MVDEKMDRIHQLNDNWPRTKLLSIDRDWSSDEEVP